MLPLYALPIHRLRRLERSALDDGKFYFESVWSARASIVFISCSVAGSLAATSTRSDAAARAYVDRHRAEIRAASKAAGLDPRVPGALIFAAQTETSIWEPAVERVLMNTWLVDEKSHLGIARALDLSVGPAQIKVSTAQTALIAMLMSKGDDVMRPKQFREAWWSPGKVVRGCGALSLPLPFDRDSTKSDFVRGLLHDDTAIETAAAILGLCALQWEQADPRWAIRARPEILASLYQIGFERSRPHLHPEANQFGLLALRAYESAWMNAAFSSDL